MGKRPSKNTPIPYRNRKKDLTFLRNLSTINNVYTSGLAQDYSNVYTTQYNENFQTQIFKRVPKILPLAVGEVS